jgi:3-dehydroquinate dehydratase type I
MLRSNPFSDFLRSGYLFCISVSGNSPSELMEKIERARRHHSNFVELRLDHLEHIDESVIIGLGKSIKRNHILTLRSKKEGGRSRISEKERIDLIRYSLLPLKNGIIDVELSTLRDNPTLLDELEEKHFHWIIASFHDLIGKQSYESLKKIVLSAPFDHESLIAVKIVARARTFQDNLKALRLYSLDLSQVSKAKLIAFCTGERGIDSRILSAFSGSPLCYTCLPGEPLAEGQLDIESMRKALERQI